MVEGEEECEDEVVENTVSVPEETCAMDPETVCKNVTVSLPNLVPTETCRVVPRSIQIFVDNCMKYFLHMQGSLPEHLHEPPHSAHREDR